MTRTTSPDDPPRDLDHEEVEWQFAVDNLAEAERSLRTAAADAQLRLTPSGERELVDQYLDTGDWAFHRAGFALRLRDRGDAAEATLKALGDAGEGPRRRREINQQLVAADRLALLTGSGPVTERVRAVAGSHDVRLLFALRTRRRTFELRSQDALLAEVALDDTAIERNGDAPLRLCRLELEVSATGTADNVAAFAERLRTDAGLPPASVSKFAAGLQATALQPAAPPDLGSTGYDRRSSLGTVAYAALRSQLAIYLANEPGTRLGDDIEALHDMRVASRRMRTSLRIFAAALPSELVALGDDLRWVAAALGEVRDLDVQLESLGPQAQSLGEPGALDPLIERLEAMRVTRRTQMLAALDSSRHETLVEALMAQLRTGVTTAKGERPALRALPPLLRKRERRLQRSARDLDRRSPDKAYHAARIRAKRLRYATECSQNLYGRRARRLIDVLKDVQDELGRGQDATITIERLRSLAAAEPALPPTTLFAMGRLAEREARTLEQRGAAFDALYRRFRRRWARLDRALTRGLDAS